MQVMGLRACVVFLLCSLPAWAPTSAVNSAIVHLRALPTTPGEGDSIPAGASVIVCKPEFASSELGCQVLRDGEGGRYPNKFTLLTLRDGDRRHTAIWGSRLSREPVTLDPAKSYRFVIRPAADEGWFCDVLKIWDGAVVLLDRTASR